MPLGLFRGLLGGLGGQHFPMMPMQPKLALPMPAPKANPPVIVNPQPQKVMPIPQKKVQPVPMPVQPMPKQLPIPQPQKKGVVMPMIPFNPGFMHGGSVFPMVSLSIMFA